MVTPIGTALKIIACTPNKNFEAERYQREVVERTQRIRQLEKELGDAPPGPEQLREVMRLLLAVLESKQVDRQERVERIQQMLELHGLQAHFPELPGAIE